MCSDHASQNMAAMRNVGVLNYGCLFHKLLLIVQNAVALYQSLVDWVILSASHFHSSYDVLCEVIEDTGSSPKRFWKTRWLSIAKLIFYLLRLSLFAVLTKGGYLVLNEDEINTLEEMNNLILIFDLVVEGLLTLHFIPLAFNIPTYKILHERISALDVTIVGNIKASMLNHLTIGNWDKRLIVATALDPRFHKNAFAEYPLNVVKEYLVLLSSF